MAHHLSAKKRIRQNQKQRARNRQYRTHMRSRIKKLNDLITAGKKEEATALLPGTVATIQKLGSKNIIHKNQVRRRVSRVVRAVTRMP